MRPEVVVVGGGYAGVAAARELDEWADVVLIEPRDRFVHNVGLLRALVSPDFAARLSFTYDSVLSNGRIVRDRVVRADPGSVELASGAVYEPEFLVLATGSAYPFPAKVDEDRTSDFLDHLAAAHVELRKASRPLLLGAGPVGIELAGEITSAWPEKRVTILEPAGDIVSGPYDPRLREALADQLDRRRVRLLLGQRLDTLPGTEPGVYGQFTVTTDHGTPVDGDIWFRCFGARPVSHYLGAELMAARTPAGHLSVEKTLQVTGQQRVFAAGDLAGTDEPKRAGLARVHAATIAQNISCIVTGRSPLAEYTPRPSRLVVPLGPDGGAGYDGRDGGTVLGPDTVARTKGRDLNTGGLPATFGLTPAVDGEGA